MGFIKYLKENFRKEHKKRTLPYRRRMEEFRDEPVSVRVEKPTRIDKARALGYKAKQGIFVVRQRVKRGSHYRERDIKGKKSRNQGSKKPLGKSYQIIAEERTAKKYVNCEVLNSYFVGKDGNNYWYEVIMVDRDSSSIKKDKQLSWVLEPENKNRVFRGLTSAGKKARGLRHKGKGAEKVRPSRKAMYNRKVSRHTRK